MLEYPVQACRFGVQANPYTLRRDASPWPQGLKPLSLNCQENLLSIVHANRTGNQLRWVG